MEKLFNSDIWKASSKVITNWPALRKQSIWSHKVDGSVAPTFHHSSPSRRYFILGGKIWVRPRSQLCAFDFGESIDDWNMKQVVKTQEEEFPRRLSQIDRLIYAFKVHLGRHESCDKKPISWSKFDVIKRKRFLFGRRSSHIFVFTASFMPSTIEVDSLFTRHIKKSSITF